MEKPPATIEDALFAAYLAAPGIPIVLRMRVDAYFELVELHKARRPGVPLGPGWCACEIRADLDADHPTPFEFL